MSRARFNALLGAALFATALALVWVRHQSRAEFVELQQLNNTRDEVNTEWGRLQLEQATWAEASRIERLAREELDMRAPAAGETRVIVQ